MSKKLRDEAWKYFVDVENRKACSSGMTPRRIAKIDPITKKCLGSYLIVASEDEDELLRANVHRWERAPPPLSKEEWTAVLCTGKCAQTKKKEPMKGFSARCCSNGCVTRDESIICMAEALQLHPQAACLRPCKEKYQKIK